jgi:putative flippase GtrA
MVEYHIQQKCGIKCLRNGDYMKKLFEQIVKFGIVGAIAFVIDYAVLFVLVQFLHMDSIIAATISFTVSVIFNYLASMKYVFVGRADQSKQTQFIIFIVLSVIGLGINDGIMWILNGILSPFIPTYYYLVSKIVATAIVMVWNFVYDYYKLLYYKADGCTERKAYAAQMADIRAGFQFRNSCLFKVCQFYNTESDFIVFGISSGISAWKAFNCDAAWNFLLYIPDNELRDRCLSEKI